MAESRFTQEEILRNIRELVAEATGKDEENILPTSNLTFDLETNDNSRYEILLGIEETFDIQIMDEDFDKIETIQGLIDVVTEETKED